MIDCNSLKCSRYSVNGASVNHWNLENRVHYLNIGLIIFISSIKFIICYKVKLSTSNYNYFLKLFSNIHYIPYMGLF